MELRFLRHNEEFLYAAWVVDIYNERLTLGELDEK